MKEVTVQGISVVIPCLNEEESIGQVVEAVREGITRTGLAGEVIVVDNGSTDRSAEIAREKGARLLYEPIRGYGSAIRRGFNNARYDLLAMGDGDMTYDFTKLDELVEPILKEGADFVIGNRMKNIMPGSMPRLHQHIGNPILSWVLRFMFHDRQVRDVHCGMRVIRKEAYRRLGCVTTGMEFASEMVVKAIYNKLEIAERGIVYHARVGHSKLRSFRDGWRHLRFLMLHSPTLLLFLPGLFSWGISLLLALRLALGPIIINGRNIDIHFMIMVGLLNILSLQLVSIGLLSKAYAHLSGLRHDNVIAWFYRWFTLEKATLAGLLLVVIGVVVAVRVIFEWVSSGFGPLDQARAMFFALLCFINGIQIGAASFLFSIMALPRHIDNLPPEAQDTGISDL